MKPSKWPFRIRSPIGDGARRGRPPSLTVAERRGLVSREKALDEVGLTAEFGGAPGTVIGPSFGGYKERQTESQNTENDPPLRRRCCLEKAFAGERFLFQHEGRVGAEFVTGQSDLRQRRWHVVHVRQQEFLVPLYIGLAEVEWRLYRQIYLLQTQVVDQTYD